MSTVVLLIIRVSTCLGACSLSHISSRYEVFNHLSTFRRFRFTSIVYPIYHRNKVTKKRITIFFVIINSFFGTVIGLSFFYEGVIMLFSLIVLPSCAVFVVIAYARIFVVASKRCRVSPQADNESIAPSQRMKNRELLKDIKLAKVCLLIVVSFFICFIPAPSVFILLEGTENWQMQNALLIWGSSSLFFNSTLNVAIFFWRKPLLRQEARKTLQSFTCFVTMCRP